ncbi:MAG: phosphodiester glycosidase family protein [Treponema sp.]|nr:phosphodiester glycosidase family protein [Treponema sp.]
MASPEVVVPQWQPVESAGDGLAYFAGKISQPRLVFHALRVDLSSPELRIFAAGGKSHGADEQFLSIKVSTFVRDNGLVAGINALPFAPVSGKEGEPRTNTGIVVTDGVMVSPPHARYDALVLYTDGSAAIVAQSAIHSAENIASAVGGFRRILADNALVPQGDNAPRHPRSAAGISSDGRFLYLLAIDGRRPGSIGSTEAETALILRALGSGEGINFDGGGSTALALRYPNGKVRVVNTPIHGQIPHKERAVAGCLGIGKIDP